MPDSTRCKFRCHAVTDFGNGYKEVKMRAEYDQGLSAEDRAFASATPSGDFTATISNPAVLDFFVPGKAYYLDVTPAE